MSGSPLCPYLICISCCAHRKETLEHLGNASHIHDNDLLRLEEKHREKSEGPIHKEWIPAAECPINCASLSTSICPSQGQIHKGYYSGFFTALLQSKHAAEVWQLCASKIAIIYVEKYRWFFYFFSRWGVKAFLENFRQWNKICGEKIYKCVASVTTNSQKMLINYL